MYILGNGSFVILFETKNNFDRISSSLGEHFTKLCSVCIIFNLTSVQISPTIFYTNLNFLKIQMSINTKKFDAFSPNINF